MFEETLSILPTMTPEEQRVVKAAMATSIAVRKAAGTMPAIITNPRELECVTGERITATRLAKLMPSDYSSAGFKMLPADEQRRLYNEAVAAAPLGRQAGINGSGR